MPMTNFERIKGFTFQELVAFLEEISVSGDELINNETCRHCRTSHGDCPYAETENPETCRLLGRSTTIEYWLNMTSLENS